MYRRHVMGKADQRIMGHDEEAQPATGASLGHVLGPIDFVQRLVHDFIPS